MVVTGRGKRDGYNKGERARLRYRYRVSIDALVNENTNKEKRRGRTKRARSGFIFRVVIFFLRGYNSGSSLLGNQ